MQTQLATEVIQQKIFMIRGQRVMIDRDLADMYGVETKYLNRQVRRNRSRFPVEFTFQLTKKEKEELVTICHRFRLLKHSSSLPYAFTEHGVAMLANVLKSEQAVRVSIMIIKVFIRLKELISSHKGILYKIEELEQRIGRHDKEIQAILEAIRRLMREDEKPKGRIGFHP
jgi:hypothetical protein